MRGPTQQSVAAAAGVSTATVSNAYNRPDRMSAAVRDRVLAVADQLGYAGPDPAGRSLRSRRAGAIGVLFSAGLSYAFTDPYCMAMLTGVIDEAERTGTGLCLMPLLPLPDDADAERIRASVVPVLRAVVDGVVADGIREDHAAFRVLVARGVPIVRTTDTPDGRCVIINDEAASRALGEHLAALGHRRIGVLVDSPATRDAAHDRRTGADPDEDLLFPYARRRLAGLRSGSAPGARLIVEAAGANDVAAGRAATARLLDGSFPPTAIAAVSDVLALGAIEAVHERGLEVGHDVSVTGFDDIPAASAAGLTTVAQPIREKGRRMARMLLDPDDAERRVVLEARPILRRTTGPVR